MRTIRIIGAFALALGVFAASDGPDIVEKKFPEPPVNMFYFDDAETVILLDPVKGTVFRSENSGLEWDKVKDIPDGNVNYIQPNPHDNQVAVAVGIKKKHWITYDQGKSWTQFETKEHPTSDPSQDAVSFHADDNKRMLYHAREACVIFECVGKTYYTTNGFKDDSMDIVHNSRKMCMWARSHPLFSTGDEKTNLNRILCIVEGKFSALLRDYKMVWSDDFFKTEKEPTMAGQRQVRGFANMASVKGFIVASAKATGSKELALYVTKDAATWHRAEFGDHRIMEEAYTILESTNYSIQVDVMPDRFAYMGTLFSSNSNGTYFTRNIEHTNRNRDGIIDFEKIQNIQGIVLVNIVANPDDRETNLKRVESRISFDDGRTWEPLKVGKDTLHVHSVTEQKNSGRIFSSPAPGLLMANGNTGDSLDEYSKSSLFVSTDAGRTWIATSLKGPHKREFLDQGSVLVAIADQEVDEISYSLDHGKTWETAPLPTKGVKPFELTTIADSTSLKALLITTKGEDYPVFALDFSAIHEKTCGDSDLEKWYARTDDNGKPTCLMGHKQWFYRRKPDSKCFFKELTHEHLPQSEQCDCAEEDFECDTNFEPADGHCKLIGRIPIPDGECKNRDDKFKGTSGFRLIPGNDCKRSKGKQKDDLVERPCTDAVNAPANGEVEATITAFPGRSFTQMHYLERDPNSAGKDETVVTLTDKHEAYISHDHGKDWNKVKSKNEIVAIYPHQYNNAYVYFITPTQEVLYSEDRGQVIHTFQAPDVPDPERQVLGFHPENPEWLLWIGDKDCKNGNRHAPNCHTVAHITKRNGLDWEPLLRYIEKCQFMYNEGRKDSAELIYCEQYEGENKENKLQLLSSSNRFENKKVVFPDVVNFATMSEFIIVAAKTEDRKWLRVDASIDGETFAQAEFPHNFKVDHQQAYTVLDSSTNSIFLHVTVNGAPGREYGTILKSNSNGTSYVLSMRHVNRNEEGYVDFEKMQGIEGVAMVNVVANAEQVDKGVLKKLQTQITHNDGADWAYLPPPKENFEKQPLKAPCTGSGTAECALHLHGYTERKDPRDTFSSPSAVGLMMGVGNIGDSLGDYNAGDTFMTTDGGITWKVAQKGTYMWEYGDQGSIVVLVKRGAPTNEVIYTLDEGDTWIRKQFLEKDSTMVVEKISTVPSDNSRNFLLWGAIDSKLTTVNLDFTGTADKECKLDKENPGSQDNDYELWYPQHPLKEEEPECLFGHKALYWRKKTDRKCYNGPRIERLHEIERNCSCTREDFECAYNYERQPDASCKLVEGLEQPDAMAVCSNDPNQIEYWDITGYRKIPLSTCSGGRELEHVGASHPCPGKEEKFRKKNGVSGIGLFFAVIIPFGIAAAIGYWVYTNWGTGKFGAIRLGDTGTSGSFSESPWVTYPVAALSGLVAIIAAIPLLAGSLWRSARGRFGGGYAGRTFTSRDSFARGRGDYAGVDQDEGELLGEDSDEDV
ncbi:vacuolar protein sorting/targeting protein 10 [Venturia nashicola]|uniref:Vacuolar protein sorting/targeting protein 10 n=1 Tax=Venturia nashicola TaxID=86259 RepID=A0A4Z1NYH1_9PEZI|nr:vacuolar protein sorting/targeting protein 10 [Venturia nashicola]